MLIKVDEASPPDQTMKIKGEEINHPYEKTVYWRKNLFTLPTRKVGKLFITEMTQLIETWCEKKRMD